jgi:hypothetical protein
MILKHDCFSCSVIPVITMLGESFDALTELSEVDRNKWPGRLDVVKDDPKVSVTVGVGGDIKVDLPLSERRFRRMSAGVVVVEFVVSCAACAACTDCVACTLDDRDGLGVSGVGFLRM